jgi:hypothetical protein
MNAWDMTPDWAKSDSHLEARSKALLGMKAVTVTAILITLANWQRVGGMYEQP